MTSVRSQKIAAALLWSLAIPGAASAAQAAPPEDAFHVLQTPPPGPRITPYLQYQLDQAWRQDEAQQRQWDSIRNEQDLLRVQAQLRKSLLEMIGGLPETKTPLHPRVTGTVQADGFSIEKLIFESLPGYYVTALVYVPDDHAGRHPAVLVPAGHATNGKIHYQTLCVRLARRGYVVIAWDPVGQGERSQFWDATAHKSRYNLVCGEHAVLGNLAYLAGANLARWEIWDGMRAVDYLLTRSDVDGDRISITGTSGGGTQATLIGALDPRIKVIIPSCYITSLPMRMGNRIFADPDSDPEQDLYGMLSNGVGHTGLLLMMYPRPVMVASAVLDFFPIEGARKTFRETERVYERLGRADRIAMVEGYHAHQYSDENQEAALNFMDRFNGMPTRQGIAKYQPLPDQDLLCTRSGQIMVDQAGAKPLASLIRDFYEERKNSVSLNLRQEYLRDQTPNIGSWQVSEFRGAPPEAGTISWKFAGSAKFENTVIDKYMLYHGRFLQMPLLFIHTTANEQKTATLWFSENGKAPSSDWAEIQKILDSGHSVVTFDFRGLGEDRMLYAPVSSDVPAPAKPDLVIAYTDPLSGVLANFVYNSLLTGRPYFFQMIDDANVAKRFATEKLRVKVDSVTSANDAYTLASAIAKVLDGVQLVPREDATVLNWAALLENPGSDWQVQNLLPGGAYFH